MKLLDISASVLYARIDFIHRQCQLFAGERERTLLDRKDLGQVLHLNRPPKAAGQLGVNVSQ